jgi:mannose-6-phosphate isomerase
VDRLHPIEGRIQRYAWGSRTALARLQGRPEPTQQPEAELWFGAHPLAPSRVQSDGVWTPLPEWIARDPGARLGVEVARRFGGQLPFLLKVLAVEQPLSLQSHPDAERAREGYEEENRAGIPLDAKRRRYRDPNPKPELVCALTRFRALKGFRPFQEIAKRLETSGVGPALPGFRAFRSRPAPSTWRELFRAILGLQGRERAHALGVAREAARVGAAGEPSLVWAERLARAHPDDVGALAPLFLHLVVLEPGSALFVAPGQLHCHLEGVAVEVMASSDNVLRGGLTSKHVDVEELLRVLHFCEAEAEPLLPEWVSGCESSYPVHADEFALSRIDLRPDATHRSAEVRSAEILLCTEGEARVEDASGVESHSLRAGEALLVPASAKGYVLEGQATCFRVAVPAHSPR